MIYIPLISSHLKSKTYDIPVARAHIGELKFVPRESGRWDKGRKKWADQLQWMLRGTKEPRVEYEVMQLGIVGGQKKKTWNKRYGLHWRLMTQEEVEKHEAKRQEIEQKRRRRLGLDALP
jgi:hypothetical protein